MKNNIILLLWVVITCSSHLFAQKTDLQRATEYLDLKGEVIFTFKISNSSELSTITKQLAIVHYDQETRIVKAMANKQQFEKFLQSKIPFQAIEKDNIIGERLMTTQLDGKAATFPLTAYPTYADYVSMMNDFATNYPGLCKVENIGTTTEGDKAILFVKLSDNVSQNEKEPRVMYTSSMHGDEIAGYPMMLNLIDLLLTAYNDTSHPRHAEIKQLLDNNEVWINPLANPDGTYRNSANNTSVANATRGNANNVDLNRNYPDPDDGTNPDGNAHQTETLAFMSFADSKHFVLSANFHGGIELVNYPWDTFAGAHPDEDYFIHISSEYRDHCQADGPNGYFDDLNNGITNGYAWYEVQGGRQDYQIYFKKGREITVELSNAKSPAANQLVNYWNYNKDALIDFLKQINYGIRGVVTDAVSNQPIQAKVTIVGKESYESWVPTELPEGDYYRLIKAGTYDILFEADCYESKTISGVTVADYAAVVQNVQLTPIGTVAPQGLTASNIQASSATLTWNGSNGNSYDVRYRKTGTTGWTTVSVNTNTTSITGLTAETSYEAQVRSNCSGGNSSPYSDSVTFTTTTTPACAGINSFPYAESFETNFGVWQNESGDDIDWRRNSGGTPSSSTGPSSAQDGSFYVYTEASANASGSPNKVAVLTSPCIDLSSLSGANLEFGYHMYGATMGSLEILASTDDGANYTSLWSRNGNLGNQWNDASVDLSAYAGNVIKLQFKGTTGSGWRSDIAFDNIKISSTSVDTQPPSAPANLASSNITSNSVDLSWNASTDDVGVTGYEVYQNGSLINTVNATNIAVTGLSPETSYSFHVIAKDGAGNSSSSSNTISVTTLEGTITYCNSQGTNVNFEYIDYVGLGGIDNSTGANGGYGDFTSLVGNVPYGANTITLGLTFVNDPYTEHWSVWIDYNKNGEFEASEKVVAASTTNSDNQTYNFTVPNTVSAGTTRMRVSLKYNSAATACESYTYGEVEDYTVNIGAGTRDIVKENDITRTPDKLILFPNPVLQGMLNVRGVKDNTQVRITNYLGQVVLKSKLSNNQIDVNKLPKGIYFLELTTGNIKVTERFVIGE